MKKGSSGNKNRKKLCAIWEINNDETEYILTKLKKHKKIKKLSKKC